MSSFNVQNLFGIQGKTALITGGGSGLGENMAEALVSNGANVIIASRKEKQLKEVSDRLNKQGPGKCSYIANADITNRAGCDSLVAEVKKRTNKLHILVNNSGTTWGAPLEDMPEEQGWNRVIGTNVKAVYYLTAGLAPLLAEGATNIDPGRVVIISSVAGITAKADDSYLGAAGTGTWSYAASKAAANSLTHTLAVTLGPKNVTVNAILPGVFPSSGLFPSLGNVNELNSISEMTKFALESGVGSEALRSAQPSGRYGTPEDVGGSLLYLVSRAGAHATGNWLTLDGGHYISGRQPKPLEKESKL